MIRRFKYLPSAALLVGAALGCHSDRGYAPSVSALIQDGNHNGGNSFFFWLPPVQQQQAPADQVFSGQLTPVLTITNLCTGEVIRTLAGGDVQASDSAYHANWHTADDNLDPACTYRMAVVTGARLLGVADVDVVSNGSELKDVATGDFIPLLADRTLPIRFFIGIGSQCQRPDSDCGEGTVLPGQSATIVTTHGQAGVSVPAGAVDQPVTIVIESSDERPCIPNLPEPVLPGSTGAVGNSCYDFHTDPPLTDVSATGKFNTKVTVGICPEVGDLDHVTQDLLQIFQLHEGTQLFALNNSPAPFLSCDPGSELQIGSRRVASPTLAARLRSLLRSAAELLAPQPLSASTRTAVIDYGAGGTTDMFSRFTWALPSQIDVNFDQLPDLGAILPGTAINTAYSHLGITFSRSNPLGLCPGTAVYANDAGLLGLHSGQNNISVCPLGIVSDFSETLHGTIRATFTLPAVQACITATPTGFHGLFAPLGGVAFLEGLDANGNVLNRVESTSQKVPQRLCVQGDAIAAVRFAGKGTAYAIFDDLGWTRAVAAN